MNKKTGFYTLGLLLLMVFSGFAFVQFNEALTPYVSYEKAIASARNVQVAGGLQKGSSSYDDGAGRLHFTLVDTEGRGETMPVRYEGVKPANFEEAISIVAIGVWDPQTEEFAAHNLLVKCPSKYQGLDEYESKNYSADDMESGSDPAYGAAYGDSESGDAAYGDPNSGDSPAALRSTPAAGDEG